jgi:hypothetical protein
MDLITFRCSACNQGLKVPGDKVGRKVKCTKCGKILTIPAASQAGNPAKAPPPKKHFEDEDDEGGATYGVKDYQPQQEAAPPPRRPVEEEEDEDEDYDPDEVAEKDEELRRRLLGLDEGEEDEDDEGEEEEEERPKKAKRRGKAKLDPAAWGRARAGLTIAAIAAAVMAGAFLLHGIVIIIGVAAGNEYGKALVKVHPHYFPGASGELDKAKLMIALISGADSAQTGTVLLILSHVLTLAASVVMLVACVLCLGVPTRFGAKGLAVTTIVIAAVNIVTAVVFKLLPLFGAMSFILVPLLFGEVAMASANEERLMPMHLFWGGSPYLQVLLTAFIVLVSYLELVLFPVMLRSMAKLVKSEPMEENATSLIKLGLGQVFMQVAYQLLAMTGSSDVLLWILRVTYCLAAGFYVGQLAWFIVVMFKCRGAIQQALDWQDR